MNTQSLFKNLSGILIVAGVCALISCNTTGNQQKNVDGKKDILKHDPVRIGMVIKIDSSRLKEYLSLHADSNSGVRDLLGKYNMKNFSIFLTRLDDGNYYEFGYYEYTGTDYKADMAALEALPRYKEWLNKCDPMQIPLKGETSWKKMRQIFFNK
jgi:L-rhamnose mutarotase